MQLKLETIPHGFTTHFDEEVQEGESEGFAWKER